VTSSDAGTAVLDGLFRRQSSRLIAALTRLLGPAHIALAEDVVQEALLVALQAWRFGVPDDPHAWILKVARNKAIDEIRRRARAGRLSEQLGERVDAALSEGSDNANQLAMMLSCCADDIHEETHVTLILRLLVGLGPREIAQAFLVDTDTIDRRIHRGRRHLEQLGELEDVRDPDRVLVRLPSVLRALYLIFNEGYHGSDEQNPLRASLCGEAMRLCDLLLGAPVTTRPEVHALQALFCLNAARLRTRLDQAGVFVRLADQDRTRWDPELIARGVEHLAHSAGGVELTRWHIEAGIACEHTLARSVEATNWHRIVGLYDALLQLAPSPVVELNRALAVAERDGVDAGRAALAAITDPSKLVGYPFYWSARADLERRAGALSDARTHYEKAIELSRSRAERAAYERELAQVTDRT
jgi:RNA polymerase sigma-70 factor (ECF subfamily)